METVLLRAARFNAGIGLPSAQADARSLDSKLKTDTTLQGTSSTKGSMNHGWCMYV